jgi:formylglycine-generating enzyme required for sulfatase activity
MDTARLLHLLEAGDLTAWSNLARDLERRADAENATHALALLHAQGHVVEVAQWLARVTDTPELQTLRAAMLAQAEGWAVSPLQALTKDLLIGAYRLIPAGSFLMGSPADEEDREGDETQHPVEISRPFLLKTTPVTQAEWRAVMHNNPSHFKGRKKVDKRRPVEQVSWGDTVRFCEALSAQTGGAYRLPTEAEWEYACRAGTKTARYGNLNAVAWYWYEGDGDDAYWGTHPVAQKRPNAWGLYDMLGNVWEWCHDWYDDYPSEPQRDPTGPPGSGHRVIRGGAWNYNAQCCRAALRYYYTPTVCYDDVGFRPAGLLV